MSRSNGVRPTIGLDLYTDGSGAFMPSEERIVRAADLHGDTEVDVDAVVIGSGAGGAVVAKELAEGGLRVAVLEEGDRFTTDDYTARPREMLTRLYRGAAQTTTFGVPPIVLPIGKTVGGTTSINSGTCFRTPAPVLANWRESYGLDELTVEQMEPFFRRVEREINVIQVPAEIAGRNAAVVRRGAERLGYSGDFIFRNVRGCVGSGVCPFGCPTSAKQHVGITYIPKSWEAGATTYSQCRADRLIVEGGRARGVVANAGGRRLTVHADLVVVGAGTIYSPLLLQRNGLGAQSGELGRNLAIHPATGVRAIFDEEIDMSRGVPQSYYIDEFAAEGIMFEGAAGPPDYASVTIPFFGRRHRDLMEHYVNLSQFGIMVSDTSRGRVTTVSGTPVIRYDLNETDVARFKKALDVLAEIYWAAGATEVLLPFDAVPVLRNGDNAPLRDHRLTASQLGLMAFHPLGTCRMGVDPLRSVVDGDLKLHGVDGLYLADGSVVPSSLGVNPQITIMSLATRLAFKLLGKQPPTDEPQPEKLPELVV